LLRIELFTGATAATEKTRIINSVHMHWLCLPDIQVFCAHCSSCCRFRRERAILRSNRWSSLDFLTPS